MSDYWLLWGRNGWLAAAQLVALAGYIALSQHLTPPPPEVFICTFALLPLETAWP